MNLIELTEAVGSNPFGDHVLVFTYGGYLPPFQIWGGGSHVHHFEFVLG